MTAKQDYEKMEESDLLSEFEQQLQEMCASPKNPTDQQTAARNFMIVSSAIFAREDKSLREICIQKINDMEDELEKNIESLPSNVESWRSVFHDKNGTNNYSFRQKAAVKTTVSPQPKNNYVGG